METKPVSVRWQTEVKSYCTSEHCIPAPQTLLHNTAVILRHKPPAIWRRGQQKKGFNVWYVAVCIFTFFFHTWFWRMLVRSNSNIKDLLVFDWYYYRFVVQLIHFSHVHQTLNYYSDIRIGFHRFACVYMCLKGSKDDTPILSYCGIIWPTRCITQTGQMWVM